MSYRTDGNLAQWQDKNTHLRSLKAYVPLGFHSIGSKCIRPHINRSGCQCFSYIEIKGNDKKMSAIGNLLWFVFGGFFMGLAWWLAGLICAVTIIGLPWAKACFVIGQFTFLPFGRQAISRAELTGADDIGTGALGMRGNVLWFIFAGIWLAIGHVVTAIGCFVTIIGIPFGIQHLKLAALALAPVGKTIVTNEVADAARLYSAQMHVTGNRG